MATADLRVFIRARRCCACAERLGRCKGPICPGCAEYWAWCQRCKQPEPLAALCSPARCARPGCPNSLADRRRRLCPDCLTTHKYCARCGTTKPHAEFAKNAAEPSGLAAQCAVCDATRHHRTQPERPVRRNSERRAAADASAMKINRLLGTGATWEEAAAEMGLNIHTARQRWYAWRDRWNRQEAT